MIWSLRRCTALTVFENFEEFSQARLLSVRCFFVLGGFLEALLHLPSGNSEESTDTTVAM